jgi:hypothetical protein
VHAFDPDPNLCIDPSAHRAVIVAALRISRQCPFPARCSNNAAKKSGGPEWTGLFNKSRWHAILAVDRGAQERLRPSAARGHRRLQRRLSTLRSL